MDLLGELRTDILNSLFRNERKLRRKRLLVAVLPTFGHVSLKHRSPFSLEGYRDYLRGSVIRLWKWHTEVSPVNGLIVCGGVSLSDLPAEALSARSDIESFSSGIGFREPIRYEVESLTNSQKHRNASGIIRELAEQAGVPLTEVGVIGFSDTYRIARMYVTQRRIYRPLGIDFGTIGVPRPDDHPQSNWLKQDWIAIQFALNERRFLEDLNKQRS